MCSYFNYYYPQIREVTDGGKDSEEVTTASSIYEFSARNIDHKNISLSSYKPSVSLIVNVTSSKGSLSVKNYKGLAELNSRHAKRGLRILLFPCNQFGNEDAGIAADVKKHHLPEGMQFELFAKTEVNGTRAHGLFRYLKSALSRKQVKGNFEKWLVGKNGVPVKWYESKADPLSLENDIIAELDKTN